MAVRMRHRSRSRCSATEPGAAIATGQACPVGWPRSSLLTSFRRTAGQRAPVFPFEGLSPMVPSALEPLDDRARCSGCCALVRLRAARRERPGISLLQEPVEPGAPAPANQASGSSPFSNATVVTCARCRQTGVPFAARSVARAPAASPSKQRTGASARRQSSSNCSSVSAVPSGATAPANPCS